MAFLHGPEAVLAAWELQLRVSLVLSMQTAPPQMVSARVNLP